MAKARGEIIRLLDQLDHPDAVRQQEVREKLVECGADAVDQLCANLGLVNRRVRTALVQVLGELGDERALLPLMRYVFDERQNVAESNARGLAMQAIMRIAQPKHASRLFDFLVDMKDDPDAFVRTYVIEAFGKLGLSEALPYVREALEDSNEFVRERAQKTLDALEMGDEESGEAQMDPEALLKHIRSATGARLTYCVKLLREHDEAFDLACDLVREDGNRTLVGLQVLQALDDPAARDVAVRHFQLTNSEADRAASLRLLAEHLDGNARASEVRAIERSLQSSDKFIALAAMSAAGRSGDPRLSRRAIEATRSGDYAVAATASEALSEVAETLDASLAEELFDSLRMVRGHRRHNEHEDLVRTEAYLLRSLGKMLEPHAGKPPYAEQARHAEQAALNSLRGSTGLQPLVITALELLIRLVPERGYSLDERWHPADAGAIVPLLEHANPSIRRRALEVIRRGAPGDAPNLSRNFEQLMRGEPEFVSQAVIPAILETRGPNAKKQLAQLAVTDEPLVRRTAESALKRLRSRQPHIDVDFRRTRD